MSKIKLWLKTKLKKYLELDNLELEFENHKNRFNNHEKSNNTLIDQLIGWMNNIRRDLSNDISHFQDSVNVLHNTVENVVHIGTDVKEPKYNNEKSWAVICVEGKLNLVKFVSLDARNARDLIQYLKQYEGGRHCIDTPYSEIFYDGLFKF
jgi:hypothetical protein